MSLGYSEDSIAWGGHNGCMKTPKPKIGTMDLRPKIDRIIFDLREQNFGMAESRLFQFLDDLDELQRKIRTYEEQWSDGDTIVQA